MSNKPYHILFKYATRSRPDKFFNGLENILANLGDRDNYTILVTADTNDDAMHSKKVMERLLPYMKNNPHVRVLFGTSTGKVNAINRDMEVIKSWDILVNFSDDMAFKKKGFDNIIRQKFQKHYPDLDGNIYFSDGFTHERISTMSIMGRKYYDRFGYIYPPCYASLFCDQEYTEVAQILGKIEYFEDELYTHHHPSNEGGAIDKLLLKNESYWHQDKEVYENRRKQNFGLKIKT